RTGDLNLDFVALPQRQGVNDRRGQANCQAVTPLCDLHDVLGVRIYTEQCISIRLLRQPELPPAGFLEFYSGESSPEPPISFGRSRILGRPSLMCSTVSW